MKRILGKFFLALLLAGAAGCATTGNDSRDPLEGFNRAMYSFNDRLDEAVGKPVASAYRTLVPGPARMMVRNFFSNIADIWIGANNLLQGKPLDALTDWTRFAMNTTMGVFGLMDFASEVGIEKHDEDFGQTFGRWGIDDGGYIVWPIIGPSTVRDSLGLTLDIYTDPVLRHKPIWARNTMTVTRAISRRADLLDASRILEEAALDKYVFQRDAYLQRRRSLVHDGNPPRAAREVPMAEALEPDQSARLDPAVAPASKPVSQVPAEQPDSAAMEAAVRLLEHPAPLPASTGG
ncbi:MAG: VacJ family lipoprotein [Candidatus Parcubacteria bacterium]|nr:VacJ family lipoprotein [Burkholderiales bacterium]